MRYAATSFSDKKFGEASILVTPEEEEERDIQYEICLTVSRDDATGKDKYILVRTMYKEGVVVGQRNQIDGNMQDSYTSVL